MRFSTKHVFVVSSAAMVVGLAIIFAISALGKESGEIMTAPLSQSDQEMSLYKFYSDQMQQGVQLTKAEKEQYIQLESRYGASRQETTDNSRRGRQTLDDYMWTTTPYEWVDISGVGTNTGITGDDQNLGPFALGFSFPFYGTSYTSIRVCSNGWLSFTSTETTSFSNTAIPASAEPNNAVYLFWDDMYPPDGGQILYYADAANQRFIVSWLGIQNISGTEPYTYQAILYPSGNIIYQYQTIPTSTPGNTSCTVGIENATGTQALQVCYDGSGTLPVSGMALFIGQPDGVPNPVTNLTGQYVAPNVVLTWTDPTHDTNGNPITVDYVQVWRGLADTGTLLGTVNPGVQSYTHVNAPEGNLTYTVRPYRNPYFGGATSIPVVAGTPAYVNNFDSNNGQWVATPATGGWEWGIPWGIGGLIPHSVPNVWGTVVSGNYADNACWQLDLNLGLVVTSEAATVEFYHWFYSQASYDGCNFKVSVDNGATWTVLTPTQGGYSTTALLATTCMTGQPAWAGTTPWTWQRCVIPIGQYVGQVPIFRFEFSSNASTSTYPGFYFDDFEIWGVSGQQSGIPTACTNLVGSYVAPNVVLTWNDPTLDSQGNPLSIDSVQIWLGAAGSGTRLGSVDPGVQTFTHLNAPIGVQTYSVRPCHDFFFGPPVSVTDTVGAPTYNNSFDADNGMWVPTPATGGWSWGAPTNVSAPAPHSAPDYWGTGLTANYLDGVDYKLDLNLGLLVQSASATVEFWFRYNCEATYDGCNFKASVDGGTTWTVLTPSQGAYTVTAISTLNTFMAGQPAWSGMTQTAWQHAVIPIGQYLGQTPIFRFEFSSDPSISGYMGFFFDDMVIWGLALPETTHVSGRVTLDGIGGAVTAVTVASNGIGSPFTHPLADSTYSLAGVQVGNRALIASLTGYISDTNAVAVPSGGLTNHNFLLRRVNPPAPTGLTGSVNTATGVVTLDWADSPDLQVDEYKIYRKPRTDQTWTFRRAVIGRTNSQGTDTLTLGGIYQYHVTAADTNVIPPAAESAPSSQIELAYGALPPQALAADTAFDNKIRLMWIDPLSPPRVEVYYDSAGASSACVHNGLGFTALFPFAWFAGHYQGSGPITIYRVKTRSWPQSTPGCPVQMGVFEDAGTGIPTFTPLGVKDTIITDPTAWLDVELTTPVTVNSGSFFVAIRQVTSQRVDIGMDSCAVQHPNTFFAVTDQAGPWQELGAAGFPEVLCMRAIVSGNIGGGLMELAPGPVQVTTWPVATVQNVAAKSSEKGKALAVEATNSARAPISANFRMPVVGPLLRPAATVFRPSVRPYGTENRGRSTLDDVIRYLVYRNTVRIDSVLGTVMQYDNIVGSANENVPYTYYVTARYDNNQESPPSNSVTARCGMPPGAPTNVTLTRVGTTQMRLQWTDPTVNADGTPCTDLVSIRVYRDGVLVGTVAAGVHQYLDSPLTPTVRYLWTLRAIDEVPLQGPAASISGVAGNPSYDNGFEADNGQWVATPATGGWEWGIPTAADGPQPHTGNKVWGTVLSGDYIDGACWKLDLNLGMTVQSAAARVEFFYWYATEGTFDGCNFKVSVNGGQTWTVVAPDSGYPLAALSSTWNVCGTGGQPAWSGDGTEWALATIPIGQFSGQTPIFRFDFTSDTLSAEDAGFYIDDLTIWGLQPASAVTGLVRAFVTNVPIRGAQVWAAGVADTAITDAAGAYTLPLDAGTYTLWYRHMHFCDTVHTNVVVETGSQTVHNAVMRAPYGQISVTSITFLGGPGQIQQDSFTISNPNGQCPLDFAISDTSAWLTTDPEGGTVNPDQSVTISVLADPPSVPGDYVSALVVTYNAVGSPTTIRVDITSEDVEDDPSGIPTEFAYHPNYPNPFNATTALRFDVPQQSRVQIAIFNIMGQEVARPVDEVFAPGRYRMLFDAGRLPSGMYLVKMSAADYTKIGKMMLLK